MASTRTLLSSESVGIACLSPSRRTKQMQTGRPAGTRTRIQRIAASAALVALTGWGCNSSQNSTGDDTPPGAPSGDTAKVGDYAKDSVLVRFRNTPTVSGLRSSLSRVKGTIEDKNQDGVYDRFSHIAKGQLAVVRVGTNSDIDAVIGEVSRDPEVLSAERNY